MESSSVVIATPSRILITGCTGFVGSYLVEQCRQRYPQAILFGLAQPTSHSKQETLHLLTADISQREAVREVIAQTRPDLVFHLAARSSVASSWQDPLETLKVNTEGTVYLLEALRCEHLAPRVVLIGSGEQYGLIRPEDNPIREDCPFRPVNPYAASKAAQDLYGYHYFAAYGLPIVRARPFTHFGPRQPAHFVIASFAQQIARIEAGKAPPILQVGNLQAQRDFLPVEDVVDAYLVLAEQGQAGEAYNIGSGHARSIQSILDLLLTLTDAPISVVQDPTRLRSVDIPLLEADISHLRAHTGWEPKVAFEVALQHTLEYWRTVTTVDDGE